MNVIEKVRELLTNYPKISEFTNNIYVDFNDENPTSFGLSSSGDTLLKEDVLGNQTRQHNFVLYALNQSFNDFDRLSNSTFLLELSYWLERQKGHPIEVTIDSKTVNGEITKLSSANGMAYNVPTGDINNGIMYQLQIYAQYTLNLED